jgi:hypothetical protein
LREEKRREKLGSSSERYYSVGGVLSKQNFAVLKVPRQCTLVLLVEEKLVIGICSI